MINILFMCYNRHIRRIFLINYQDFKKAVLGKAFDIDGYYGAQCWDGTMKYMIDLGYKAIHCTTSGYAKDIWNNRKTNGILNYCNEVTVMQPGDIAVFREVAGWTPYSHIAIFDHDAGGGYGWFLGQNQGGVNGAFNLCKLPYSATFDTAFRPKCFVNQAQNSDYSESKLIDEHAYATLKYDIQKRRDTPTGLVVETLKSGRKLEYTQKWVGNGHRYISWVEHQADGASYRYFVAVNGNEQGTEPWAEFTSIEEQKPTESITLTQEDGVATFTVDGVRARYDSPTGTVCKTYNTGDSIRYYWKYLGNGHRYVVGKDGDRKVFIAVSATEDRTQMWATFTAPDDSKPTTTPTGTPTKPSKPIVNTNGFTSVNEGDYEGKDKTDVVFEHDGVIVDLIDKSLYPYKCPYLMDKPQAIIIHNSATPNGTARALNKALHNSKEYKSWHFSVDDKDIIESLPLNRNAFATGDGAYGFGNRTGIQIEIAKDNDNDSQDEWKKARENGARLASELLYKYGLSIDCLKKHQDYKMTSGSYKYCPHKILDEGWDDFKSLVSQYLDELSNPKKDDSNDTSDSNDKINVNGINKIIALILKLLKKVSKLFK